MREVEANHCLQPNVLALIYMSDAERKLEVIVLKIQLKNAMETLIIPLYGKAKMSEKGIFPDPFAEETIMKLDYDYSKLKIQYKTQMMLAIRAAIMDAYARDFIAQNPSALVLHLGCGLDARYMRLEAHDTSWYDLDFPEVIDIKKQLFKENDSYHYISSSVTDLSWIEEIKALNKDVLVIAEGLFMYLTEEEIKALMVALQSKFNRYSLIFDAYSKRTARLTKHHPSLKKTGAVIQWGIDNPKAIEDYTESATYIKTIYLTDDAFMVMLPKTYQRIFKLAGHFKGAKEAHRVIVMKVE